MHACDNDNIFHQGEYHTRNLVGEIFSLCFYFDLRLNSVFNCKNCHSIYTVHSFNETCSHAIRTSEVQRCYVPLAVACTISYQMYM